MCKDGDIVFCLEVGETFPTAYIYQVQEDGSFDCCYTFEGALKYKTESEARTARDTLNFKEFIHICEHEYAGEPYGT